MPNEWFLADIPEYDGVQTWSLRKKETKVTNTVLARNLIATQLLSASNVGAFTVDADTVLADLVRAIAVSASNVVASNVTAVHTLATLDDVKVQGFSLQSNCPFDIEEADEAPVVGSFVNDSGFIEVSWLKQRRGTFDYLQGAYDLIGLGVDTWALAKGLWDFVNPLNAGTFQEALEQALDARTAAQIVDTLTDALDGFGEGDGSSNGDKLLVSFKNLKDKPIATTATKGLGVPSDVLISSTGCLYSVPSTSFTQDLQANMVLAANTAKNKVIDFTLNSSYFSRSEIGSNVILDDTEGINLFRSNVYFGKDMLSVVNGTRFDQGVTGTFAGSNPIYNPTLRTSNLFAGSQAYVGHSVNFSNAMTFNAATATTVSNAVVLNTQAQLRIDESALRLMTVFTNAATGVVTSSNIRISANSNGMFLLERPSIFGPIQQYSEQADFLSPVVTKSNFARVDLSAEGMTFGIGFSNDVLGATGQDSFQVTRGGELKLYDQGVGLSTVYRDGSLVRGATTITRQGDVNVSLKTKLAKDGSLRIGALKIDKDGNLYLRNTMVLSKSGVLQNVVLASDIIYEDPASYADSAFLTFNSLAFA